MFQAPKLLALGALLLCGTAQAAAFNCTSALEGYDFAFSGAIKGNSVIGKAAITVTQAGKLVRHATFAVTASQFVPNQLLSLNATGESNSKIVLATTFANGAYAGPMHILSDEGNIDLAVTCAVK